MRNITQEAKEKAKQQLILQYPQLADKTFREQLDPFTKQQVIAELRILFEYFEQELIEEIQHGTKE